MGRDLMYDKNILDPAALVLQTQMQKFSLSAVVEFGGGNCTFKIISSKLSRAELIIEPHWAFYLPHRQFNYAPSRAKSTRCMNITSNVV